MLLSVPNGMTESDIYETGNGEMVYFFSFGQFVG